MAGLESHSRIGDSDAAQLAPRDVQVEQRGSSTAVGRVGCADEDAPVIALARELSRAGWASVETSDVVPPLQLGQQCRRVDPRAAVQCQGRGVDPGGERRSTGLESPHHATIHPDEPAQRDDDRDDRHDEQRPYRRRAAWRAGAEQPPERNLHGSEYRARRPSEQPLLGVVPDDLLELQSEQGQHRFGHRADLFLDVVLVIEGSTRTEPWETPGGTWESARLRRSSTVRPLPSNRTLRRRTSRRSRCPREG